MASCYIHPYSIVCLVNIIVNNSHNNKNIIFYVYVYLGYFCIIANGSILKDIRCWSKRWEKTYFSLSTLVYAYKCLPCASFQFQRNENRNTCALNDLMLESHLTDPDLIGLEYNLGIGFVCMCVCVCVLYVYRISRESVMPRSNWHYGEGFCVWPRRSFESYMMKFELINMQTWVSVLT